MKNSTIVILYLGVTNSIFNKNDKRKEKNKKKEIKNKDGIKDNKNTNKVHKNDNQNTNIKSKEEKRLHDNKIIKILPPIPEAGLLALQVIYDDNDNNNDNNEKIKNNK